ncbi:4Fe-4S dicluster domain-containing protein [Chloroflexota bacterium]
MADKAILFDATRCTACRGCQVSCKQWNENDEYIPIVENGVQSVNRGSYENPADLSPSTWLKIEFREVEAGGQVQWLFTRRSCMHCTDASCVKVCPTGALYHNELGFVAYNKDICSGCGYCIEFCPFDVPRSDRNILTGAAKMDKCTLCTTPGLNRITEGWEPACVKTCPTNALIFGDRSNLVADGKTRVANLISKGWTNATLYGENELGGLHVMYVLNDRPDVYGLNENPQVPATAVAWKDVVQPVGLAVGGAAIVGLGLNYLVARANANKEEGK